MRSLTLLVAILATPAFAQPAESFGKLAAPFIDEHTLVVTLVK